MHNRLIQFFLAILFCISPCFASTYFNLSETVEYHENIHGNQTIIASEIVIQSNVDGDLFVMGGTVEINGEIHGKAMIISGNVQLRGTFYSDLTIYGGNVSILPECRIYGNLEVFGSNTEFMGECLGPAQFINSNLRIAGTLQGKSRIYAAKLVFTSSAMINGLLTYSSPAPAIISDGAYFKVPPVTAPFDKIRWAHGRFWGILEGGATWLSFGMNYLFTFVFGILLLRYFRKGMASSIGAIDRSFGRSLLWGFCAFLIAPITIVFLFMTLLGIPLAFTLLALSILTFASAKIIPILWGLKKWQSRKNKSISLLPSNKAFAIGLLIFLFIVKIPLIGGLISLLCMFLGVGGVLKSNFESSKEIK